MANEDRGWPFGREGKFGKHMEVPLPSLLFKHAVVLMESISLLSPS